MAAEQPELPGAVDGRGVDELGSSGLPGLGPWLQALADIQRQALTTRLNTFVTHWDERQLSTELGNLPAAGDPLRPALLIALCQADLRQRWQRGQRTTVEAYLRACPELCTLVPRGAPLPLLLAEYESRQAAGDSGSSEELLIRFPAQASGLRRWLESLSAAETARSDSPTAVSPAYNPPASRGSEPSSMEEPKKIGRYRVIRPLGEGGMGAVYLAEDEQLHRKVAVKVPLVGANADRKLRFLREARAAATLTHPNICPIYDAGEVDGLVYLTMAYIEGKPLSEEIAGKPVVPRRAAMLVYKLALALGEAHAHNIIHRDIKPANVLLNMRGEPILMDFGLARRMNQDDVRLTQSGVIVGTPAYMAPEQVSGSFELQGPCTDIYSLGILLYELLTGRPPFTGQLTQVLLQIIHNEPPLPSTMQPGIPQELEAICMRALAKSPDNRFVSMKEMAAGLAAFIRQRPAAVATTSPASPGQRTPAGLDRGLLAPGPILAEGLLEPARTPPPQARLDPELPLPFVDDTRIRARSPDPEDGRGKPTVTVSKLGRGEYRSISEAVQMTPPGTRILVEPGLYWERLVLTRPAEIIASGSRDDIILEGAEGPALVMKTDFAIVRGLTLRCRASSSGKHYPTVDIGQGRLVLDECAISSDSLACVLVHGRTADPVIRLCLIRDSRECGVLFTEQARGTLEECEISGSGLSGVEVKGNADPTLRRCRVHNGKAGGVFVWDYARATLEQCDIRGSALSGVEVKGGAAPVLRSCTIRENKQCGLFVWVCARVSLDQCEIRSNDLSGIEITKQGSVTARSCRISGNGGHGVWVHEGGAGTFAICTLSDNRLEPWHIEAGCKVKRLTRKKS